MAVALAPASLEGVVETRAWAPQELRACTTVRWPIIHHTLPTMSIIAATMVAAASTTAVVSAAPIARQVVQQVAPAVLVAVEPVLVAVMSVEEDNHEEILGVHNIYSIHI